VVRREELTGHQGQLERSTERSGLERGRRTDREGRRRR